MQPGEEGGWSKVLGRWKRAENGIIAIFGESWRQKEKFVMEKL